MEIDWDRCTRQERRRSCDLLLLCRRRNDLSLPFNAKNEKESLTREEENYLRRVAEEFERRKNFKGTTRLGRALIAGAEEMLAHVRGEIRLESYTLPGPIDVKAIRGRVGMSQAKFAAAFALNPRTLQQWEQHKATPDGAVRAYLTVIDHNPAAVVAALRG